jgi:hypothetical protein
MINPMEIVPTAAALSVIATATRAAWLLLTWLDRRHVPRGSMHAMEARLTELERSSEAIALELEGLAEAQRFSAKLLAERLPAASPAAQVGRHVAAPERVLTPH